MRDADRAIWFPESAVAAQEDLWRVYDGQSARLAEAGPAEAGAAALGLAEELTRQAKLDTALGAVFSTDSEHAGVHWDVFLRSWAPRSARDWEAVEPTLERCQEFFSARGVDLETWSHVCLGVQAALTPRLIDAYGSERSRLGAALVAMNRAALRILDVIGRGIHEARARELAEAEKNAALASARFKSLAESGMLGVLICDYAGNILEANDGFLETFGYSRADLLSGRVQWSAMTPPEWRHLDEVAIEQLRVHGKTRPWEKEYFHKNGSRVSVLVGVAWLNEATTIAFVLDISERKRLEAVRTRSLELESENRRIQEASRLKSEFLANMSHELRTPLNSIIGFAELLHDREVDPASPQYVEFLGDILRSGRHLQQLINDVLDLAKVEAGKIELRPEEVDVAQLIAEVCAVLRGVAANKGIRIEADVAKEAQRATLDPGRFKQILYNYLSNALKFTPEGGKVNVSARPEGLGMLCLTVEDTGIGIAPADLGRLFVDFQQLEAGATKKHAGTGLGLALTKRLVEAQGGSVGVKSVVGRGSQFFAILPMHAAVTDVVLDRVPAQYGLRSGAASVLVIEDDARDRALLIQTLARAGYGVEAVATGRQGITSCSERVFDAITLDLLLPDMTGLDVLHRIRLEGQNQLTPVIVVSIVAERGMMAGFSVQDYLTKPVNGRHLLQAFEQARVPPRKGKKILIVDDDPAAQRLMSATLKDLGYDIHVSSGGEEALAFASVEQPLAVVLDLVMPGVDGIEFLIRFREMVSNRSVPVIIWTMKDLTSGDHKKLREMAQAIVEKNNWRPSTFLDEIRALIIGRSTIPPEASEVL
jgi:PAS domain S-box-containing protein